MPGEEEVSFMVVINHFQNKNSISQPGEPQTDGKEDSTSTSGARGENEK